MASQCFAKVMTQKKIMQAQEANMQATNPKTMNNIMEANMEPKISTYQVSKGNKTEKRYKV